MKLLNIHLRYYRNIELSLLDIGGANTFLLGPNGQGKTNLLEAIGFITALRSFRTQETQHLRMHQQPEAQLLYTLEHEQADRTEIAITLYKQGKTVCHDQTKIIRLGDFIGQFPTVALSADDIHLLRGAPGLRRRFLDLTLSAMNPDYMQALQAYHKALQQRNSLLKQESPDEQALHAFEKIMAPTAALVVRMRQSNLKTLASYLREAYDIIGDKSEIPDIDYQPHCNIHTEDGFLTLFDKQRPRDRLLKSTQYGPQRDDFLFLLKQKPARDYASEGQQRALVLSLRLAQLKYFWEHSNIAPIILADDILSQLDPKRQEQFWQAVDPQLQIIATGTTPPKSYPNHNWHALQVNKGQFTPISF